MLEIWPANSSIHWRLIADAVMGGVSRGTVANETLDGRETIHMRGDVSTENNGGFVQIALDLVPEAGAFDASGFTGLEMDVLENHESYGALCAPRTSLGRNNRIARALLRRRIGRPCSYRSYNSCHTEQTFRSMSDG